MVLDPKGHDTWSVRGFPGGIAAPTRHHSRPGRPAVLHRATGSGWDRPEVGARLPSRCPRRAGQGPRRHRPDSRTGPNRRLCPPRRHPPLPGRAAARWRADRRSYPPSVPGPDPVTPGPAGQPKAVGWARSTSPTATRPRRSCSVSAGRSASASAAAAWSRAPACRRTSASYEGPGRAGEQVCGWKQGVGCYTSWVRHPRFARDEPSRAADDGLNPGTSRRGHAAGTG